MRVLITGGSGAIGAYLVDELLANHIEPVIVDRQAPCERHRMLPFVQCDLTSLEHTICTVRGCDAVIHLAAIPNPSMAPADRLFSNNVTATFNVLEAVRRNGIRRIVYGGSESCTGFGIHSVELQPLYLPIDEAHPCWPHEAYGASKLLGEVLVENYARAYGLEAISLRYTWVWLPRDHEVVKRLVRSRLAVSALRRRLPPAVNDAIWRLKDRVAPRPWFGCYVSPQDVAQAIRLALEYALPGELAAPFEAFYITADTTHHLIPTLEALGKHFAPLPPVRDATYFADNPFAPPFDTRKAKRRLGFTCTRLWQDYAAWDRS